MDERTTGAVRAALREVADQAGSGTGGADAVVRGAVHRGRARLRRRQRLVRAGASLALLAGGGLVVTQLPVGSSAEGGSTAAGGGGGGGSAASASAPSGEAAAPDALQDTTAESSAASAPVPAGAFTAVPTVDGWLAVVRPPPEGPLAGPEALISGRLAVLDGGCLGFRYDDGTQKAVVWPSGTTALPDAVGLDVPGLGTYRLGDPVEGSGGYGDQVFEGPLAGCPSDQVASLNEAELQR